jgi:hypothetical protein
MTIRSHNTPATCASSAERTPSSAPLLVSGTASPAGRPLLEEPTPSRKRTHLVASRMSAVKLGTMFVISRTPLTLILQNPCCRRHKVNDPSSARDCRGLREHWATVRWSYSSVFLCIGSFHPARMAHRSIRMLVL